MMRTITRQVRLLVPATVGTAVVLSVALADEISWQDWPQLALFFSLVLIAYSIRIQDPRGGAITPSTILSYVAMYVLTPGTALLIFGLGRTLGYVTARAWVPWRALFNGAQIGLSVSAGAWVFRLVGGNLYQIESLPTVLALVSGPLVSQVINNLFVAVGVSRWRSTPLLRTWIDGFRDLFWPNLLSIPTATILALVYVQIHYAVILAYLVLLPFQRQAINRYIRQRRLYAQIIDGLVVAADVNFPMARGHARRVADLAVGVAREMRLSEAAVESVQFAALLHDIGMIGKDDLLEHPVLTVEDAEGLRDHVRVGAEIARKLPRREIATLILHHHERYDGTGYPDGLKGETIPLGARIIGLAEVVDSVASGVFPYGSASPIAAVVSHVASERGRAFDPDVVDAFLRVVDRDEATAKVEAAAPPDFAAQRVRPEGFRA